MVNGRMAVVGFVVTLLTFFGIYPCTAADQAYPTRPIELTIGYAPGAGTDLGARMIAEKAKKALGQDIVCVNKPGGGGRLALTLLAKVKPDGYNLAATTDSSLILTPNLEKVPYKPMSDFTFISQFGVLNFGLAVQSDSPFKSFKDIVDYIEKNPDTFTISTVGEGAADHMSWLALAALKKWKIKLVPFNGAAPAMTALLGGHVMAGSTASSGFAPYVKAKQLRLIASMAEQRLPEMPDVPTFRELGYPLSVQSWYLISGPKGMDKAAVKKLSDAFQKAMETPEFIKMATELEILERKPRHGDQLTAGLVERNKRNEETFSKLKAQTK